MANERSGRGCNGASKPESPKAALKRVADEARVMFERYPFLRVRSRYAKP